MKKNEKEYQMLYEWGVRNHLKYNFLQIDKERESYFIKRQNDSYIREYTFDTLPELMGELDLLWKDEEMLKQIKKVIGVAAMKNKPTRFVGERQQEVKAEKEEKMPAFIYNF